MNLRAWLLIGMTCLVWCVQARALGTSLGDLFVVRVHYANDDDIQRLVTRYDVHEFNDRDERYLLVTASTGTLARLRAEGWQVTIDTNRSEEFAVPKARFRTPPPPGTPQVLEFYGAYKTAQEIVAHLHALTAAYPHIASLVTYGTAYCRGTGGALTPGGQTQEVHDLLALRVTATNTTSPKPVFVLMAAIHAREITTPEVALRFAHWLLEGYRTDADATWLVNEHDIWIIPLVNPEGHWLVSLGTQPPYNGGPFTQRKNAHQDRCTAWTPGDWQQYGIDLNRNHNFQWGTTGISTIPCDLVYCGLSAASEPETVYLQNLITNLIPDQRGPLITDAAPSNTTGILISLHTYGRYVLWPWGHTSTPAPNAADLRAIGLKLARGNRYRAGQSSTTLYATSGDSTDWAYGTLGIPAFTFEMGSSFMPAYSAVDSDQWPTNKSALIYAAKIARAPYQLVHGPDALQLALAPTSSNLVVIEAAIDERGSGSNLVAGAEFSLQPFGHASVESTPMYAADGAFDSVLEHVTGYVDIQELDDAQTLVYVRGRDALGNWGPASAIFAGEIPEPAVWVLGMLAALTLVRQRNVEHRVSARAGRRAGRARAVCARRTASRAERRA